MLLESTRSTSDITPYRLDEYLERSRKFLDASRQSLRCASARPSPPFISGPRLNAAPCQSRRGKSSGLPRFEGRHFSPFHASSSKYVSAQPPAETAHPCWLRLWWNTSYTLNPIHHPVASSTSVGIALRAVC